VRSSVSLLRSTLERKEEALPRYVVERTFAERWSIAATPEGAGDCRSVVERNADWAVTWLHSYVSADGKTAFCVYEAPTPEAIRKAAAQSRLPVDRIVRVRVLDPYFDG
jgi:hypothetical protein